MSHWRLLLTGPRLAQLALDMLVAALAWGAAYVLRFDGQIPHHYRVQLSDLLVVVLAVRFACRFPFSVHQQLWRYASLREAVELAAAVTLGSLILLGLAKSFLGVWVPWGVLVLDWGLNLAGLLALRGGRRLQAELAESQPREAGAKRVILVGAGQAGVLMAREVAHATSLQAVGFVDDDPSKQGGRVAGLPVLGRISALPKLAAGLGVDEAILCIPSAKPEQVRQALAACSQAKLHARTLPGLQDLLAGRVTLSALRELRLDDLLGRDPVRLDPEAARAYLAGRVVMITGAGGSIGSELVRQIAQLGPKQLLLVGRGEDSLHRIDQELAQLAPHLPRLCLLADVRNRARMAGLFAEHRPQVVFHAAAHKHVPLVEANPVEAVTNNVQGTQNMAELALAHGVEAFVLVSTDKAVNPTNLMGASKRVAEKVVRSLQGQGRTRFMVVRFGNVLGSRGSVVPIFQKQIAAGGPVTLTHPDIIRYFMTIPEASQLVIQAGALGQGGEAFVLDMGEPVRILDLARDMIRLHGLEPEVDVPIVFTGLRPGEKLYEELLTAEEGATATQFRKIFVAKPEEDDPAALAEGLARLQAAAASGEEAAIRAAFQALVPSYRPEAGGPLANPLPAAPQLAPPTAALPS